MHGQRNIKMLYNIVVKHRIYEYICMYILYIQFKTTTRNALIVYIIFILLIFSNATFKPNILYYCKNDNEISLNSSNYNPVFNSYIV
jgi:hypothetical protein